MIRYAVLYGDKGRYNRPIELNIIGLCETVDEAKERMKSMMCCRIDDDNINKGNTTIDEMSITWVDHEEYECESAKVVEIKILPF